MKLLRELHSRYLYLLFSSFSISHHRDIIYAPRSCHLHRHHSRLARGDQSSPSHQVRRFAVIDQCPKNVSGGFAHKSTTSTVFAAHPPLEARQDLSRFENSRNPRTISSRAVRGPLRVCSGTCKRPPADDGPRQRGSDSPFFVSTVFTRKRTQSISATRCPPRRGRRGGTSGGSTRM